MKSFVYLEGKIHQRYRIAETEHFIVHSIRLYYINVYVKYIVYTFLHFVVESFIVVVVVIVYC